MNLIIKDRISQKVKEVQSKFDMNDFKSSKKSESKNSKNNGEEIRLITDYKEQYDKKTTSDEIYVDENGVYHYVVPHCSHCGSTHVTKHDTNWTPIHSKDGKKEYVEVKKYNCKSCGKGSQVEFKDEFKKNSGLPVELDEKIVKLNSLHWISLRDKQKILKLTLGLSVSIEYIRKAQLITDKLFWRDESIVASDYVNYDVQWVPVDFGWSFLHMLIDNKLKKIIAVQLTKDEEKETTKKFFKKVFKVYPKVIITDLKPGYHELIKDEMGIDHQECLIHFRKALNKKIRKELNKIKNKIQGKILFENPKISDSKLEEQTAEIMEPIIDEYWSYKDNVMKTFDIQDYNETIQYIWDLRKEAQNYPKAICNYLTNNFFNVYRSLILYKHWDYKDIIPSNNNLSESKIGWCASKFEKRKYRTDLGFFNHVVSRIKYSGNF